MAEAAAFRLVLKKADLPRARRESSDVTAGRVTDYPGGHAMVFLRQLQWISA